MLGFLPRFQKREGEHLEENKSFQDLCKICISNLDRIFPLSLAFTSRHRPGRNNIWRCETPYVGCVEPSYHHSVSANRKVCLHKDDYNQKRQKENKIFRSSVIAIEKAFNFITTKDKTQGAKTSFFFH